MNPIDPKAMAKAMLNAAIVLNGPYLSITDAALVMRVSRRTVDRLIKAGRINSYRPDPAKRKVVLKRSEIDQAITSGRVIPAAPFED